MIYLIGGAPRVGRSTIASQLAGSLHGRLVSTDGLEYLNKAASVCFYPDEKRNILTPEERLQCVLREAGERYDSVSSIIRDATLDGQDTVVEGVHVLPSIMANLLEHDEDYGRVARR